MPDMKLSRVELVALLAMLVATVAFSIDSMLPAMPEIAAELAPDNIANAQLILSAFIIGMGAGTLFTGPISDMFGRKPVIIGCTAIYIAGAFVAWQAPTLEMLILGRFLQGLGASGPRVVSLAVLRDLYSGRDMARLLSFVMMVFTVVPALSPLVGSGIIALTGWRGIFLAFVLFALVSSAWLMLRLPETLPEARRRSFSFSALKSAAVEMTGIPMVRLSVMAQVLTFAMMFSSISMIQPIFDQTFDRADSFPWFFFGIGLFCSTSSMVNAALVMKLGMRKIISVTQYIALTATTVMLAVELAGGAGAAHFWFYLAWQTLIYFQMGLVFGNLNALAMEPLGHIAGLAASVMSAISTILGGIIATVVAQFYDGTPLALVVACWALCILAVLVMRKVRTLERVKDADAARAQG
ncbi:multidrug effflux MFS transporter [Pseudooceanicola nanhaiensis]|uniref:multidrug effflux MFS transporter n=1 Tax=Pseudooceanicola nanhaiensis TaxID=375761 RepID=UPI001CD57AE9|nr:multidrug effflux MFS transporter [Pseudooceanicola nanhaiensis]MCA0920755.1 multidrug effflux MFS transporter [Pseudooceanicola nanhaiensis]